jgi:hypothetical protein
MDVLTEVSSVATDAAQTAWLWGGSFLALIVLTVILLIFALRGGKGGLISLILALYAGYAIYVGFPYTDLVVSAGGTALIKAVISIGLFLGASLLPFLVIRRLTSGGYGSLSFIPNLLLSVLSAGFLLALGYHVFDISNIYTFTEPLKQLFAPEGFFWWWFIAPLIGLFLFAR